MLPPRCLRMRAWHMQRLACMRIMPAYPAVSPASCRALWGANGRDRLTPIVGVNRLQVPDSAALCIVDNGSPAANPLKGAARTTLQHSLHVSESNLL